MKKMKFLGIITIIASLFHCASAKFDSNPPFKVNNATYNKYVGGVQGVSGMWVRVNYETTTEVVFDSLFYQGRKTKIEVQTIKNKTYASGHFNTSTVNSKADLMLHSNGKKEYGNKAPEKKFPFELKENEAVISYLEKGETKFFKVENIKKAEAVFYPSAKSR